jgi:hypothetical protein
MQQNDYRSRFEAFCIILLSYLEERQLRKLRTRQNEECQTLYSIFADEFKVWDHASNEALENFEKGLEEK